MKKENLAIVSNEKTYFDKQNYFCDNIDMKSIPEGLNESFDIQLFVRNSKSERSSHKINLKNIGNKLDIHAGIPGPASLKTLISYAKSCGIGNSMRFLSKQAFNITKLASPKTPDKLIYDLAEYKINNNETNLKKLHFYPFGGIKKTTDWLNKLKKSNFLYNLNNEFEILDE